MLRRLVQRIAAIPAVYDGVQSLAGQGGTKRRLRPFLDGSRGIVLELGAGTGAMADLAPESARYLWLDNDPEKLSAYRRRMPDGMGVLGDAANLGLRDKCVDVAMCVAVSHHLTDSQLTGAIRELARVCFGKLVFVDAIARPESYLSNFLWKYDRGSHPRSPGALIAAIEDCFEIEHHEQFTVYHTYLICVGRPLNLYR